MADDEPFLASVTTAEEIADTLTFSARTFSGLITRGLRDAVVKGKSLEGILKRAALSLTNRALSSGLRPLGNLIGGGLNTVLGGLTKSLTGGLAAQGPKIVPFAEGGVIGAPAAFGLKGGRVGLMGEAGREAVLPLARGTDGRLGVALEGKAAPTTVTINVSTPDAASFQRSEAQVTAMLARAVKRGQRGL